MKRVRPRSDRLLSSAPAVPAFPVLSAELDEEGVAWFQGRRVEPREGEEAASAVMRLAAEAAGARAGSVKAVRVRASSGGSSWNLIVDESGEVWDAPAQARSSVTRRQKAGLFAALAGVLTLPVAAAAAIVGPRVAGSDEPVAGTTRTVTVQPPRPTATQLPVLDASGAQMVAAWASDRELVTSGGGVMSQAATSPAVAMGQCVAAVLRVDRDAEVRCLRADTGAPMWSVKLGSSSGTLWPAGDRVVVASSTHVRVLDQKGRTVSSREPTSGERPVLLGGGVVVQTSKTSVLIDERGRWVPRVVPAGASVVGVRGKAAVMADRSGQVWSVTDARVAPTAQRLTSPAKDMKPAGVVGLTTDGFLFGWETSDTQDRQAVVQRYRLDALSRPVFTTSRVSTGSSWASSTSTMRATVSPSTKLAVIDGHLVDLATGAVRVLPEGWRTTRVLDAQVFGQAGGSFVVVDAQARPLWRVDPPSGVEVGVPAAQISGVSFVPATAGRETRLYATRTVLPAGAGSPSSVPSSTASPPLPSGRSSAAPTSTSSTSTPSSSSTSSRPGGAGK